MEANSEILVPTLLADEKPVNKVAVSFGSPVAKLTKVFLHGRLGKLFGKEWSLAVKSPAEAIRAIDANLKGALRKKLAEEGTKKFYKVSLGSLENLLDKEEIIQPSGNVDIHIVPVAKGRKSGVGKILAAVALVAITYFTFGAGSGATAGLFGMTAAETALIGYGMAASLALGGIVQLLTPIPSINSNAGSDSDGRGSNIFQGNSTISSQGSAVGLVYGRMMVTPMPVSLSLKNYDQNIKTDLEETEYESIYNNETGLLEQRPKNRGDLTPSTTPTGQ
jgi:predicted phage tail protein